LIIILSRFVLFIAIWAIFAPAAWTVSAGKQLRLSYLMWRSSCMSYRQHTSRLNLGYF